MSDSESTTSTLSGRRYWRSLNELENTPEFESFLQREFQENASVLEDPISRRSFLRLMGASVALATAAGSSGCFLRRPEDYIVPYTKTPKHMVIGEANWYASSCNVAGSVQGILVRSNEGRPTKIEGLESHPWSQGGSNHFVQSSLLDLYDPDRAHGPERGNEHSSWEDFSQWWSAQDWGDGHGIAFLHGDQGSPSFQRLKTNLKQSFPEASWHHHDPVRTGHEAAGLKMLYGRPMVSHPDFRVADVVLSLDCDFLGLEASQVKSSKDFAQRRKVENTKDDMNRLYVAESHYSVTGAQADHRMKIRSHDLWDFALALVSELQRKHGLFKGLDLPASQNQAVSEHRVQLIAADLAQAGSKSLVVAGSHCAPVFHALAAAINQEMECLGHTLNYTPGPEEDHSDLSSLVQAMNHSQIHTLVILDRNPVYDAPVDFEFGNALTKVKNSIFFGSHFHESAQACRWRLAGSHHLETWMDHRNPDGSVSLQQPLIQPLWDSKGSLEFLSLLAGQNTSCHDVLQNTWKEQAPHQKAWRRLVHDGMIPGTAQEHLKPRLSGSALQRVVNQKMGGGSFKGLEVNFRPDYKVYDGSFANNGWLQELPEPITKVTWDNPALISPNTAKKHKLQNGDLVNLKVQGRSLKIAVWIVPGHAEDSVTLTLGYGRGQVAGMVAGGVGFNTYNLRSSQGLWSSEGDLSPAGGSYPISSTQDHGSMQGRHLVREQSLKQYRANPTAASHLDHFKTADRLRGLSEEHIYSDKINQWGMVIDLNACTGCNACVVGCQAENNIPIVGKQQVALGREMHWIRIDRYFSDVGKVDPYSDVRGVTQDEPEVSMQPINCQHCENAPCEQVCPVAATTHSPEGLNDMAYNRCIGTRYCANNCPYKVRRFNFLAWEDHLPRAKAKPISKKRPWLLNVPYVQRMVHNPEVSVRGRGVMEKCTFCVQRIQDAKIKAKGQGRTLLKDGEVDVACAQACPSDAIVFGNLSDKNSQVAKLQKRDRDYTDRDRSYELLRDLNTRPRVTFLAKLRNPNPLWT